ncbi:MAG: AMP-binding protein [Candidatus Eisenbacteria bacterium]
MNALRDRLYALCPVSVQDMLVSAYGRRILGERFGPDFDELRDFLEISERAGSEEMEAYQDERLRTVVAHAYETVPYYTELMDGLGLRPSDIETRSDLRSFPLLTRDDVIENRERLVSTGVSRERLRLAATSGTTGYPVSVYWDHGVTVMNNACLWRARRWGGVGFGRPYATLMGRPIVPARQKRPPYWRFNSSWNQLILSSYHLDEESVPFYLGAMRERGVEMLEAYPSAAYMLARYMEMESLRFPLKSVLTSSEPLLDIQRELIEERFGCRVLDAYGQAERVAFASECERHEGLHVFGEYGVVEILDGDGRPVGPGGSGQIVATGLHNMAMPLIRYATGDSATLKSEPCSCGRTLPMLSSVTGKAEDIVVTPLGRMVPGPLLSFAFKGVPHLVRSQIVQDRPDQIRVLLVTSDGFLPRDEERVRAGLSRTLGGEVAIVFERVDEIPMSARGKYRWVVSNVPLRWGKLSTSNLYQDEDAESARAHSGATETG